MCFPRLMILIYVTKIVLSMGIFSCRFIESHKNVHLLPKPKKCGPIIPIPKIMGGTDAAVGEFPWMVFLDMSVLHYGMSRQRWFCDGTIINNKYILTAAHCLVEFMRPDVLRLPINVILGAHSMDDQEVVRMYASEIVPHERFDYKTSVNDIALVRLSADIAFNEFIYPICLPLTCEMLNKPTHNKYMIVAGWGLKESGEQQKELLATASTPHEVPAVTLQKYTVISSCSEDYEPIRSAHFSISTDRQMCTLGVDGYSESACQGDSGGPVMMRVKAVYQMGVVSWGGECSRQRPVNILNVATKLTSYILWILERITE